MNVNFWKLTKCANVARHRSTKYKCAMTITLTKREQAELEATKQTLIIAWNNSETPKIDAPFFWWCRRSHKPYVRISKRRKFANVMMDLPNASGLLDTEGSEQLRLLCRRFGVPEDAGNTFRNPSMNDVPLDLAEDFARKLLSVGLDFCQRNPAK